MTALQTLTFDGLDAFVDVHALAWPDLAALDQIYDGPRVTVPTEQTFVIVGCDNPTETGLVTAVDSGTQDWESLGATSRMETFGIWCNLVLWTGDSDPLAFRRLRGDAKDRINDLGAALRPPPHGTGDAMLNDVLNLGGVGWCGLSINRLQQISDKNGCTLHVQYALGCTARI